jgi:hypothetical protein
MLMAMLIPQRYLRRFHLDRQWTDEPDAVTFLRMARIVMVNLFDYQVSSKS